MTITLEATKAVAGVAANATSVTYTILGDEVTTTDTFKVLAQGQLPAAAATLYAPGASTATIVKTILLVNTAGATQAVTMYIGGTAAANSIGSFNIPAGGSATWNGVWNLRDANGASLTTSTVTLTGDVSGTGTGSIATTLATVATPATTGDATHVAQVTVDAKGRTTTATSVAIAIPESAVTNLVTDLAGKQPTGNYLTALTGDVAASGPGSAAATLATVNANTGSWGTASAVPTLTVNAKGLVTAAANTSIVITESQVTNLTTDLAGKQAGPLTGDVTTSGAAATLATVNGSPGTKGSASAVPVFVVNAKGLVTSETDTAILITESQVINLVTDLAAKAPTARLINTTAPLTGGGDLSADRTFAITQSGTGNSFAVTAGVAQPKELGGVAYITAGNPQGWAGADFGAWANAAWAYLIAAYPQIGGEIRVGPGIFTCSTPMVLGTQFAAISLTGTGAGFGGPSGASLGAVGGTVINYTPTSGICLTIGGTDNNGGGIKVSDLAIQGTGIGNGATAVQVGIQSGATGANAFASQAGGHWSNVTINGFTNGVTWNTASHIAYAQHFYNCRIQYCTNGLTPFGEANVMFGGLVGNCVTGVLGNIAGSDFNAFGTAFDDNSTTAVNVSQALFRATLVGCRFENAGGGTDTYITQSDGSILIKGGSMQSDIVAVGTSTGFCQITGGLFNLDGCWLYNSSANRTFTQIFNVSSGCKSFNADPNISPSSAAFGPSTNTASAAFPRRTVGNAVSNVTAVTATTGSATTYFSADSRGGFPIPAAVRPGTTVRCTAFFSNTATIQTTNMKITFGTGNAATDATIQAISFTAGTAAIGACEISFAFTIESATTAQCAYDEKVTVGFQTAAAFTGAVVAPVTIATTSPTFIGFYFASTVANIVTCRSVNWEILSQGN